MRISWKLRMAAAQRGVWTGTDLGRLLEERAGMHLSSASLSSLFTKQPSQVKLTTLIALCTALECTPNDLIEPQITEVATRKAAGGQASNGKVTPIKPRRTTIRRPGGSS